MANPFSSPAYVEFSRRVETHVDDHIFLGKITNYEAIMDDVYNQTGVRLANRHPWLSYALGDMVRADHAAGRALRSSIVHSKKKKMPSDGFFDVSMELGIPFNNRKQYAKDCVKKVFEE